MVPTYSMKSKTELYTLRPRMTQTVGNSFDWCNKNVNYVKPKNQTNHENLLSVGGPRSNFSASAFTLLRCYGGRESWRAPLPAIQRESIWALKADHLSRSFWWWWLLMMIALIIAAAVSVLVSEVSPSNLCSTAGLCCKHRDSECVAQKVFPNHTVDTTQLPCYCDHACLRLDDCCPDYKHFCAGKQPTLSCPHIWPHKYYIHVKKQHSSVFCCIYTTSSEVR